jgi:DNA-binding MarR family transcriptional regulator
MKSESSDPVATAGALIGFARALKALLQRTPGGVGLTLAELNVLAGIEKGHDLTSTLARVLLLDAPRVSRVVDGFVESGYVVRDVDPNDRRRARLRLTPEGTEVVTRGRRELGLAMEELLRALTDEEREGLQRAVPGMRRVLSGQTASAPESE